MSWKKTGQLDLNMKQRNRSQPARSGDELWEKEDEKNVVVVVVDVDGEADELGLLCVLSGCGLFWVPKGHLTFSNAVARLADPRHV